MAVALAHTHKSKVNAVPSLSHWHWQKDAFNLKLVFKFNLISTVRELQFQQFYYY